MTAINQRAPPDENQELVDFISAPRWHRRSAQCLPSPDRPFITHTMTSTSFDQVSQTPSARKPRGLPRDVNFGLRWWRRYRELIFSFPWESTEATDASFEKSLP
jgi:hypothetical protein